MVVTTNTESAVLDQHREKLFRRISYSIRKINRVAPFIPKCSFRRSFAQSKSKQCYRNFLACLTFFLPSFQFRPPPQTPKSTRTVRSVPQFRSSTMWLQLHSIFLQRGDWTRRSRRRRPRFPPSRSSDVGIQCQCRPAGWKIIWHSFRHLYQQFKCINLEKDGRPEKETVRTARRIND